MLARLINRPWFEPTIIALIVINAVLIGLETSPSVMARYGFIITIVDDVILAVFVLEIGARMIVHRAAFWRDPWSLFDLTVVAIALVPATGNLSILRALRIIRALRLVSAIPSMRRVVSGLLSAMPGMGSVLLLLLLLFYVASVMATKLYGAAWPERFGTVGESAYTLFQVMTMEGWSDGIVRPLMEKAPMAWLFFIPFIVIAAFIVLKLFLGIVVDAIAQQQEEEVGDAVETMQGEHAQVMAELAKVRAELAELRARGSSASEP
jgi:voltage-gated sodium channel